MILLAYDFQEILQTNGLDRAAARKVSARRKPLWSVRINVRAIGNNFPAALPAMADVGADHFRRQLDDLVTVRAAADARGQVDVGPPKVLNVVK